MDSCLIITDVQNDFCPGGALPVAEGGKIIPVINAISHKFNRVVATQDWHPPGHISFAKTHHRAPYEVITVSGLQQVLWPEHCLPGSFGADFHKDLDLRGVDLIIRKGRNPGLDSYSTFLENDKETATGLHYYLRGLKIEHAFLCGLATDYCIYNSALDARRLGFQVTVIVDACMGVDMPVGNVAMAIEDMKGHGIRIMNHQSL